MARTSRHTYALPLHLDNNNHLPPLPLLCPKPSTPTRLPTLPRPSIHSPFPPPPRTLPQIQSPQIHTRLHHRNITRIPLLRRRLRPSNRRFPNPLQPPILPSIAPRHHKNNQTLPLRRSPNPRLRPRHHHPHLHPPRHPFPHPHLPPQHPRPRRHIRRRRFHGPS